MQVPSVETELFKKNVIKVKKNGETEKRKLVMNELFPVIHGCFPDFESLKGETATSGGKLMLLQLQTFNIVAEANDELL